MREVGRSSPSFLYLILIRVTREPHSQRMLCLGILNPKPYGFKKFEIHRTVDIPEYLSEGCMIINNVLAGIGLSFGYEGLRAISNGLATYVLNGQTLDDWVAGRGL